MDRVRLALEESIPYQRTQRPITLQQFEQKTNILDMCGIPYGIDRVHGAPEAPLGVFAEAMRMRAGTIGDAVPSSLGQTNNRLGLAQYSMECSNVSRARSRQFPGKFNNDLHVFRSRCWNMMCMIS